ncbi:hypothetical protein ACXJJ3_22930 [Kribbella sp. WER1]
MAQSDPEPRPPAAEQNGQVESEETAASTESAESKEPELTPEEKARRTVRTFLWTCAWLTVLAAAFLLSDIVQSTKSFGPVGWFSVVLTYLSVAALLVGYFACALGRATLRTRLLSRFDLFQVSTLLIVIAVVFGLLIPTSHKAAVALLLPWALTYWMYGLDRAKPPADSDATT